MFECVGREKGGFVGKINERCVSMRWGAFLCELPKGVLVPLWLSKKVRRYPSCHNYGPSRCVILPSSTIVQTTRPLFVAMA